VIFLNIEDLDIPDVVKNVLRTNKITKLYPPQEEVFRKTGILKNKSALISIPTASGKTLIAEIVMLKRIIEEHCKALYLVPLKALASQKYSEFDKKWGSKAVTGEVVSVAQSSSDFDTDDQWLNERDIILATNEKADSLYRHKPKWMSSVKVLVVDEIHLIDDKTRGPTLEIFIAKMLKQYPWLQVIGLSATIPNAIDLAKWLKADLVTSDWRPVKLRKGVYYNDYIYYDDKKVEKVKSNLPTALLSVINDTLQDEGQVLAFLPTRRDTVSKAKSVSKITRPYVRKVEKMKDYINSNICSTRLTQTLLGETLCDVMKKGTAFHNAGLSSEQRSLVELGFTTRYIKCVVATPTLAIGVNLPARRVCIIHKRYNAEMRRAVNIKVSEYNQMSGRAGRPGLDEVGEALLFARTEFELRELFDLYINGESEPITSKLNNMDILTFHVLAFIAQSENAFLHHNEVLDLLNNTFFGYQNSGSQLINNVIKVFAFLDKNDFIEKVGDSVTATDFGTKTSQLYIFPNTALLIKHALKKALERANDTGISKSIESLKEEMKELKKKYAELKTDAEGNKIEIKEIKRRAREIKQIIRVLKNISFSLVGWVHALTLTPNFKRRFVRVYPKRGEETSELEELIDFYDRHVHEFYIQPPIGFHEINVNVPVIDEDSMIYLEALKSTYVIYMWAEEYSERVITEHFKIGPGDLSGSIETLKWLLYSTQELARLLDMNEFLKPLSVIEWRVSQGVKEEILELTKLRGIGRILARRLYKKGIKSIDDLKKITPAQLVKMNIKGIGPETAKKVFEQIE